MTETIPLSSLPSLTLASVGEKQIKDLEFNQQVRLEVSEMSDDQIRELLQNLNTNRVSPAAARAQKKRVEKVIKGVVKPIEFDLL